MMQDAPVPGSAQRRKTLSKQGIATVQATGRAPESGPEYDLLNDEFMKPSFGFLKHKEGFWQTIAPRNLAP